jgi:SAM-dependent methyltransferase
MAREDASRAEFWERRFREGVTPWDAGRVPALLERFQTREAPGQRVLIPGCGSGYEVRFFAEAGFDVVAIDFAPAAIERARQVLGPFAPLARLADFFSFDPEGAFDLIYERAFLCALPRQLWPGYASRVAELLRPGGRLAGFFFFDHSKRGPPFGLEATELEALLGARFERVEDTAVADSIPIFAGKERWQVWRCRALGDATG